MSLPTPESQSSGFLPQQPHVLPSTHSMPTPPLVQSPSNATAGFSNKADRASDFAANSWDLATGGLKTLTAKRELPPRLGRRPTDELPDTAAPPRNYMFSLVILVCIVVMLISGGIVLFMLMQP